jgi:hypothetical protein
MKQMNIKERATKMEDGNVFNLKTNENIGTFASGWASAAEICNRI